MEEEGEVEEVLEMKDQSLANGEKEKVDTPVVTRAGRQVRNHKNSSKRSLVLSSNTLFTSESLQCATAYNHTRSFLFYLLQSQ